MTKKKQIFNRTKNKVIFTYLTKTKIKIATRCWSIETMIRKRKMPFFGSKNHQTINFIFSRKQQSPTWLTNLCHNSWANDKSHFVHRKKSKTSRIKASTSTSSCWISVSKKVTNDDIKTDNGSFHLLLVRLYRDKPTTTNKREKEEAAHVLSS